ncbi:NADH-ubiquinone oxidoreductase chain C [Serinicoccus hydrothermalis]|uniref:NADH-ubiquinone oxidoreductase chain C n=1 Tax=Serinicoccus hydrothermalis TaxID=1758689 RepID=A0A1B1NFM2_9MICO|nr:NADH-quinone oxidoreductase subunit C [Serinicoccus hydrothermalis]ANS80220.1 NADH-ubiquinone oxidoreductase chain C [Serinicoccus hydrothermalis]
MRATPGATPALDTRRLPAGEWHEGVRAARAEGYAFFDWLSGVDESDAEEAEEAEADAEPGLEPGVDVLCHLIDVSRRGPGGLRRLLLRTRVPEGGSLASVTDLFAGAAWHERETHEMYGVGFEGFDDGTGLGLRPLLLPEGFEGTPLRKSFVLGARASKPWPGAKEPGEGPGGAPAKGRRPRKRLLPPGVPDPSWGPRES